jgi:hypothetical protein
VAAAREHRLRRVKASRKEGKVRVRLDRARINKIETTRRRDRIKMNPHRPEAKASPRRDAVRTSRRKGEVRTRRDRPKRKREVVAAARKRR